MEARRRAWYPTPVRLPVVLLGTAWAVAGALPGCGSEAIGVDACREVEYARCEATATCPDEDGVVLADVEACKRFYRDHCLHGLTVSAAPSTRKLTACRRTIEAAGRCAAASGPDTPLASCAFDAELGPTTLATACDLVAEPEQTVECGWLTEDGPVAPSDGGNVQQLPPPDADVQHLDAASPPLPGR